MLKAIRKCATPRNAALFLLCSELEHSSSKQLPFLDQRKSDSYDPASQGETIQLEDTAFDDARSIDVNKHMTDKT